MVCFEERNLLADEPDLWVDGTLDVIICRNVLMYFTALAARAVLEAGLSSDLPESELFGETLEG